MNKTELIKSLAKDSGLTQEKCSIVLDSFVNVVSNTLCNYERVIISGFGAFDVKHRAPRTGRNPMTGEEYHIDDSYIAIFKPSKALKEAMND